VREIRMLRLTWQGMETWLRSWRHSLTLPEGGAAGKPAVPTPIISFFRTSELRKPQGLDLSMNRSKRSVIAETDQSFRDCQ